MPFDISAVIDRIFSGTSGDCNSDGEVTAADLICAIRAVPSTPVAITRASFSGRVVDSSTGHAVAEAIVQLTGVSDATVVTDADGAYSFVCGRDGDCLVSDRWSVRVTKSAAFDGSVTMADAQAALDAAAGKVVLTLNQQLSCDASGSGTISGIDAGLIRSYVLSHAVGKDVTFPAAQSCGSDWLFVPASESSKTRLVQWPMLSPGMCELGGVSELAPRDDAHFTEDFFAVRLGDCDASGPSAEDHAAATL